MWRAGSAITRPVPGAIVGWHVPQSASLGCGGGGGAPWHEPHWLCAPLTTVHTGLVDVPPAGPVPSFSVAPWQYTLLHVVPFHAAVAPARLPNAISAGSGVSTWPIDASATGTLWH